MADFQIAGLTDIGRALLTDDVIEVHDAAGLLADTKKAALSRLLDLAGVHPGYIAGNWYLPNSLGTIATGAAITQNSIRLLPYIFARRLTISDLGARITIANAGGNCQFAIYANDPTINRPTGNALGATGNISTASAGNVSAVLSGGNLALEPGVLHWFAVIADNIAVAFQAPPNSNIIGAGLIGATTQDAISTGPAGAALFLSIAHTFGTWPDLTSASFTQVASQNTSAAIQFKVA